MSMDYYNHDFEDLLKMYDEVCGWFSSLGFEYSRTRYGIYKKHVTSFVAINNGENTVDNLNEFKESFDNAYLEVNEIIRIYNSLKDINSTEFIAQIKKVISGREFRGNMDGDQARDFLFELSIATRFLRAGYTVSLTGICDVVVDLGQDGTLYVECKRIKSEKKLADNVKKANKQISTRIKASFSNKVYGLVAINITDLIPKTNMMFPSSEKEATIIHRRVSNKYVLERINKFTVGINKKCFGVMCESAIMNHLSIKSTKRGFTYSRHTEFIPYSDNKIYEKLAPILSNQDIK